MAKATSRSKKKAGPYLSAALVCEKVLFEEDNVSSLIRVVDTIQLPHYPPLDAGDSVKLPVVMLVMLKSGDFRGEKDLILRLVNPSGKRITARAIRLTFT